MHLKGHTLLKIRRFLNHKIAAGLEEVETLDQKLIDAYRGWVQGPRGVTGHDGSFPSNDEALPLVIIEFEAEETVELEEDRREQDQLQAKLSEDEQAERRRELERAAEVMRKRREAEMEERQARFRRQAPQQSEPEDGGSISFTTETGFQKNQDE